MTKVDNVDEAKRRFKELINDTKMYYNDKDIPANESDANAHKVCSTVKGAERYCPHRTAAMKNWFDHSKQVTRILTSVVCKDLSAFGLYLRPRSRFSHTDLLLG